VFSKSVVHLGPNIKSTFNIISWEVSLNGVAWATIFAFNSSFDVVSFSLQKIRNVNFICNSEYEHYLWLNKLLMLQLTNKQTLICALVACWNIIFMEWKP
jgi:hypothetical protein